MNSDEKEARIEALKALVAAKAYLGFVGDTEIIEEIEQVKSEIEESLRDNEH